jgi:N-acetylmuramoyl-L-alanine amidase
MSARRLGKWPFRQAAPISCMVSVVDPSVTGTNSEGRGGTRPPRRASHARPHPLALLVAMRPVPAWLLLPLLVVALLASCSLTGSASGPASGSAVGWGAAPVSAPRPASRPEAPAQAEASAPETLGEAPAPSAERPARPVAAGEASAEVTRVSIAERSDGRGYVVRLHTTGPVPAYRIEEGEGGRLSLTLFQTNLGRSIQRAEPRGPIRQYALRQAERQAVLTLEMDPEVTVEARAYPDRDTHDLLLALTIAPRRQVAAGRGSNGADAASVEHWRLDCIVIDAGHGGHDPGAVAHGVREKDVTLGIALKLGRYIQDQLGVRVVYTRRDDRFIELAERGRIANQSCGKLFVSIHANAAGNAQAQGTETYFLGVARTESARRVMERENSVVRLESDPSLYSGMDDAALIMQTMAQSTYLRVSEQLAAHIEGQFSQRAGRTSRGVKQAGFLVLWRASMPAVLVETGFVTNAEEAAFLGSDRGQDLIASAIFRAIRDYKAQYERGLGMASQ